MMLGPYELGPGGENEGIYTGDARLLSEAIPDESIDLIFTDPVYQNIDDYRWLAETAARVLKPDSACLVWCWIGSIPAVLRAMDGILSYRWTIAHYKPGRVKNIYGQAGYNKWTPLLWLDKGKALNPRWMDCYQTMPFTYRQSGEGRRDLHRWSKDPYAVALPLGAFCKSSAIVFDPFTGGGTVPAVCKMLGRRYLAFEIMPDVAELARTRVCQTQPPLFTLEQPVQQSMEAITQ